MYNSSSSLEIWIIHNSQHFFIFLIRYSIIIFINYYFIINYIKYTYIINFFFILIIVLIVFYLYILYCLILPNIQIFCFKSVYYGCLGI